MLLIGLVGLCRMAWPPSLKVPDRSEIVLENVTVVTPGVARLDQRRIVVSDGRIASIDRSAKTDEPARFVLPGEGATDYVPLLRGLKEHGYTGCVCVEVSGMVSSKKDYEPVAAARKCYAALVPAFEKAGARRSD